MVNRDDDDVEDDEEDRDGDCCDDVLKKKDQGKLIEHELRAKQIHLTTRFNRRRKRNGKQPSVT